MAGYFWKWRMHGGAVELAGQARAALAAGERPDALIATSMTNLPAFLALLRREIGGIPSLLYMHENQLTYPLPPGSKRDLTYGMMQHLAMLSADRVRFNSAYHLRSWFDEVPRLLKHFPDYTHLETVAAARDKSAVLPVGCDLRRLDRYKISPPERHPERSVTMPHAVEDGSSANRADAPLILWNQRWEYDKDPETDAPRALRARRRGAVLPRRARGRELSHAAGRVRGCALRPRIAPRPLRLRGDRGRLC